jgi:hypothetical protein
MSPQNITNNTCYINRERRRGRGKGTNLRFQYKFNTYNKGRNKIRGRRVGKSTNTVTLGKLNRLLKILNEI